jgi:hypothetical protein
VCVDDVSKREVALSGNFHLFLSIDGDPLRQDFANATDFLWITDGIGGNPEITRI